MTLPPEVSRLIARFTSHRAEYEDPAYLEARVRIDFINPFFSALGWDVSNTLEKSERARDVITEGRLKVEGKFKAPDYIFQLDGKPVFMVEAKKPAVNLRDDPRPALQLRRYAWNSRSVGLGILTDFQELAIYDCSIPPSAGDRASDALVDYYEFGQYGDKWDEIFDRISRTAAETGALDIYATEASKTKGKRRVDKVFLADLDSWRQELATTLARRNHLDEDSLNYATQLIIDRIVFLRICEDRQIEPYGTLRGDIDRPDVYRRLMTTFQRADDRYNSGLFHFQAEPNRKDFDRITPGLNVPDDVLAGFVEHLYWPHGPYDFAVFPPDVLGHVYEQFLGKRIRVSGRDISVEEKPEVRKAGGVFYTPTHITNRIVRDTLGKKLADCTPQSLSKSGFYVCDPSCGSGSFLIAVYQYLLDWHLDYYVSNDPQRWTRSRPKRLQTDIHGQWRLTTVERKRILLDHVFGVDIDPQAVEVSKLSLLLKVLEGETDASLYEQVALIQERVLPDLDGNIKCGNSLIGSAFHLSQIELRDPAIDRKVNAFDWDVEFPQVAAGRGFDVMVGNPPWLMAGYYVADSVPYLKSAYESASKKFDLYYVFLEQALRLLAPGGSLGMIVPNKFFHTGAAAVLRSMLSKRVRVGRVIDFGLEKVFEGATNYSCIVLADKEEPADSVVYEQVLADLTTTDEFEVDSNQLGPKRWNFQNSDALRVFSRMNAVGVHLEEFVSRFATGIQSGRDRVLMLSSDQASQLDLEPEVLKRVLRGRDVRAFGLKAETKFVVFPYVHDAGGFRIMTPEQLKGFPRAYRYLMKNHDSLAGRVWFGKDALELSGEWYGFMYVEDASSFDRPHLLTPSLSKLANFARGDGSLFVTGTAGVTGIVLDESKGVSCEYLLGVLNSNIFSVYVNAHSPIYQGGYRKYSAPYLRALPIRLPSGGDESEWAQRIVVLVRDIESSVETLAAEESPHRRTVIQRRIVAARNEIETNVSRLYGLDEADRMWIEARYRRLVV